MREKPVSRRPTRRYHCYYGRYSPHVGQGSRTLVELYNRGMRWSQDRTMPFEIAVDPPFLFTVARLNETHVLVCELQAADLEGVFFQMQADRWPEGEIVAFGEEIQARASHTQRCVQEASLRTSRWVDFMSVT